MVEVDGSQSGVGRVRLDVFGRFRVDLVREGGLWRLVRLGTGMSAPLDVVIPSELDEEGAVRYLEDLWHESSEPGARITRMPG
jgi:hypothetical protein